MVIHLDIPADRTDATKLAGLPYGLGLDEASLRTNDQSLAGRRAL